MVLVLVQQVAVVLSLDPVQEDGTLVVFIQSTTNVAGFQFDLFDTAGNPVDIINGGGALVGTLKLSLFFSGWGDGEENNKKKKMVVVMRCIFI